MRYLDKYLNQEFDALEKEYERIYGEANKAVRKRLRAYLEKHSDVIEKWLKMAKNGLITEAEYKRQVVRALFSGKEWQAERFKIAMIMENADQKAVDYMNGRYDRVYEDSRNIKSFEIEKHYGRDLGLALFAIHMLKKHIEKKKLDKVKDVQWNERNVQTSVEKNINSKKTIKILAKDCAKHTTDKVKKFNGRYAQYSIWGMSGKAEIDAMIDAKERGIETKKEWIATLDNHTRDLHRGLDGQVREVEEPFEIDGYEIMEPRDTSAEIEMWINCRCSLETIYPKYDDIIQNIKRRENIKDWNEESQRFERKIIDDMTYSEWEEYKKGQDYGG